MKSLYPLLALLAILILPLSISAQTDDTMEPDDMEQQDGNTVAVLIGDNTELSTLNAALGAANLTETLEGDGPFTIFAPTNEAFRSLPEGVFDALLKAENRQALIDILMYHVAEAELASTDVTAAVEGAENGEYAATTLNGDFTAMVEGGTVVLTDAKGNRATVTQPDITGTNGVVHIIDAVLLPENLDVDALLATEEMEPELGAVDNANGIRRPVDEPTNEMIAEGEEMRREAAEMEEGMEQTGSEVANEMGETTQEAGQEMQEAGREVGQEMQETGNEVASEMSETTREAGQEMQEAGREVGQEMQEAGNEVASEMSETTREAGQEVEEAAQDVRRTTQEVGSDITQEQRETSNTMEEMDNRLDVENDSMNMGNTTRRSTSPDNNTIVDVAAANTDFRTLINAVEAAELEDVLASEGEFTVFAPTEAAFGKLPEGTVNDLTQESNKEKLQGILTYHVVASKISAADLMKAIEANNGYFRIQTMGGNSLIASIEDGNVILTDGNGDTATVTSTDVEASNGVIHVIDGVLMPRTKESTESDSDSSN